MTEYRCDIEFLDPDPVDKHGIHMTRGLRINGQLVHMPHNTTVKVTAGPREATVVTVELMATSVSFTRDER